MLNLTAHTIHPDAIGDVRNWSLNQDLPAAAGPALRASITQFSILHPPILQKLASSEKCEQPYEIICGARRIDAARKCAQINEINCLLVDDTAAPADLLTLAAEDQLLSEPLSAIQTARLIALAGRCDPTPEIDLLNRLTGLHSKKKGDQLLRLLTLDETIRIAIHEKKCSVQTGLFLLELQETDRAILFEIFSKLSLNTNKQRRLIDLCRIIAATRQCSIADIFRQDYPELFGERIDNIPQKTGLLMKSLYQASHPLSSRAEEAFSNELKEVKLPGNCRVTHSPSFEQDTVTLEIDFPRFEDFRSSWESIRRHCP